MIQSIFSQLSSCFALSILVEHDITFVFDENTLRKRSIKGPERVLSDNGQSKINVIEKMAHSRIIVIIILQNLLDRSSASRLIV